MLRNQKSSFPRFCVALTRPLSQEASEDAIAKRSNAVALDILKQLPGVTPENMLQLATGAGSLSRIATMSVAELAPLMGLTNAKVLREYLHKPLNMVVHEGE